jgi:adenylylsulfate kinase
MTVWLTGLPCSGKTTLGLAVEKALRAQGRQTEFLDGDILRHSLWKDLGFAKADREDNIRRIGFIAEMLARHGIVAVVSAVSPYRAARDEVRGKCGGSFVEVYVNAPLSVCEHRDVKGMYGKARRGELAAFTGVSDPYEPPLAHEVECHTDTETIEQSAAKVLRAIADVEARRQAAP